MDFTYDDILKEMEKLEEAQPEGWTMQEMMDTTGRSDKWCRQTVKKLITASIVQYAGRRKVTAINNSLVSIPIYSRT